MLDDGFAIISVVQVYSPPAPSLPDTALRELVERDTRLRQERILMDRLARALLADMRPDVLDASLRFAREASEN